MKENKSVFSPNKQKDIVNQMLQYSSEKKKNDELMEVIKLKDQQIQEKMFLEKANLEKISFLKDEFRSTNTKLRTLEEEHEYYLKKTEQNNLKTNKRQELLKLRIRAAESSLSVLMDATEQFLNVKSMFEKEFKQGLELLS